MLGSLSIVVIVGLACVTMGIETLRRSLQRDSAKTQALLAEIRDRLGK